METVTVAPILLPNPVAPVVLPNPVATVVLPAVAPVLPPVATVPLLVTPTAVAPVTAPAATPEPAVLKLDKTTQTCESEFPEKPVRQGNTLACLMEKNFEF